MSSVCKQQSLPVPLCVPWQASPAPESRSSSTQDLDFWEKDLTNASRAFVFLPPLHHQNTWKILDLAIGAGIHRGHGTLTGMMSTGNIFSPCRCIRYQCFWSFGQASLQTITSNSWCQKVLHRQSTVSIAHTIPTTWNYECRCHWTSHLL